ncbi:hypothetical protein B484DRAFT_445824 [Ochromonadaceae sp. CCMP2298]|nr:hypothetical protein B484DRAFT_445824 [Ochromonadaceae sp. CCMP2298]
MAEGVGVGVGGDANNDAGAVGGETEAGRVVVLDIPPVPAPAPSAVFKPRPQSAPAPSAPSAPTLLSLAAASLETQLNEFGELDLDVGVGVGGLDVDNGIKGELDLGLRLAVGTEGELDLDDSAADLNQGPLSLIPDFSDASVEGFGSFDFGCFDGEGVEGVEGEVGVGGIGFGSRYISSSPRTQHTHSPHSPHSPYSPRSHSPRRPRLRSQQYSHSTQGNTYTLNSPTLAHTPSSSSTDGGFGGLDPRVFLEMDADSSRVSAVRRKALELGSRASEYRRLRAQRSLRGGVGEGEGVDGWDRSREWDRHGSSSVGGGSVGILSPHSGSRPCSQVRWGGMSAGVGAGMGCVGVGSEGRDRHTDSKERDSGGDGDGRDRDGRQGHIRDTTGDRDRDRTIDLDRDSREIFDAQVCGREVEALLLHSPLLHSPPHTPQRPTTHTGDRGFIKSDSKYGDGEYDEYEIHQEYEKYEKYDYYSPLPRTPTEPPVFS